MGWSDTWGDILQGGNPRWKIVSNDSHQKALSQFQRFVPISTATTNNEGERSSPPPSPSVFCPLAGDDPIVYLLWERGYSVTSIDLVPAAVDSMRSQFTDGTWSKATVPEEDGTDTTTTVWTHDSGRATLYVGDALRTRSELINKFDAVYDKDSFGALRKEMRTAFCQRIAEYCKQDATVYIEVKLKDNHDAVKDVGPPFSLQKEDLMEYGSYGSSFEYVEGLGSIYDLPLPSMKQTGHILRRV
mmetsp:Transcript_14080/g.30590  ORF Transcript_14080/g.30590 Transcript_14080/m.30590 type:complete len:244 (+) Transcript_14080:186-917(+)